MVWVSPTWKSDIIARCFFCIIRILFYKMTYYSRYSDHFDDGQVLHLLTRTKRCDQVRIYSRIKSFGRRSKRAIVGGLYWALSWYTVLRLLNVRGLCVCIVVALSLCQVGCLLLIDSWSSRGRRGQGHDAAMQHQKLPRRQLAYRGCCFTRMYASDLKKPRSKSGKSTRGFFFYNTRLYWN
jgi:hypothetical protein